MKILDYDLDYPIRWRPILGAVSDNPQISPSELMQVTGLDAETLQADLIAICTYKIDPYPADAATLRDRYGLDADGLITQLINKLSGKIIREVI